ncbi:MAG: poly-beta-1,6 N-acetyl-D-glucosamine export porin PgaA [Rhodoferax sp.]|uniref:poly-beta-1,6 N-acetyl-D-glucosamine export porin PgaA n=1 Tax=Rhodoferax sp. TaxID=50421 RepID=UPI00271CA1A6|nr:poly-beta-1,6 N-acetyl-D-glucosamine export porin PgaA [Rhodoferax sp.]MDO8449610.1 poly-beta-1,6 N-acetyl-D-glucosamine export porin PgaA [Rhodoferax sp.]
MRITTTKLFLSLGLAVSSASAFSTPSVNYQQAIIDARAGRFEAALPTLERLVRAHPGRRAYLYDWIAVLSWADRHDDALRASRDLRLTKAVPDYVVAAIGKSALNAQQPARAVQAYRLLVARQPRNADAARGLSLAMGAAAVKAPSAAGAPELPQEAAASVTPTVALPTIQATDANDEAAAQERNASHIRAAQTVLDQNFTAARYRLIDAALAENEALTARVAASHPVVAERLRLDHIVALRLRGRFSQAVDEFKALQAQGRPLPAYVLTAAADALLALRQPKEARALYQRALATDPGSAGIQTGLVYAQLEAENFPGVNQIVQHRLSDTQGSPQARLLEISALRWADRLKDADVKLLQLRAEIPDDVGIWLAQADLLAQRGLPRAAARRYLAVLAAEPAHLKARVGLAEVTWAQGAIQKAAQLVAELRAEAPEHPAVQRLLSAWQRNKRVFFTSGVTRGLGQGPVDGNNDTTWASTLYSGQSEQGLRLLATHHLASAQWWWDKAHLYAGDASHERAGLGLEWTRRDLQITAELGSDWRNGEDHTWALGAGWQINDQWSMRARYESQTNDFPLKARVPGVESGSPWYLHGSKGALGVAYRRNESGRVAVDFSSYQFNDGNQREALAANWSERLYSGYGRTLDLQTAAYTSTNSRRDAVYFNPRRDLALSATLTGDWLLWRRYNRSFNHRLAVTLGGYRQQSGDAKKDDIYGWDLFHGLHYEHEWKLGPDRSVRYGVGVRRFPYDGNHETSHYADLTFNWRF